MPERLLSFRGVRVDGVTTQVNAVGGVCALTLRLSDKRLLEVRNGGGPLMLELSPTTGTRAGRTPEEVLRTLVGRQLVGIEIVSEVSAGTPRTVFLWLDGNVAVVVRPEPSRGSHLLNLSMRQEGSDLAGELGAAASCQP